MAGLRLAEISHGKASARHMRAGVAGRTCASPNSHSSPTLVSPSVVGCALVHTFGLLSVGRSLAIGSFCQCLWLMPASGGLVGWALARRQIRAGHSLAHPCSFRFTMGFPRQGRCSSPHCPSLWQGSGSPVRMAGLRLASVGWASSSPVRVGLGYTARPIGRLGRFRRRHLHCRAGVGHFRCSFGSAFSKQ